MNESELKKCWKCKNKVGRPMFVNGTGHWTGKREEYVTCSDNRCMSRNEFYTVSEWQSHERPDEPPTVAELQSALKRLMEVSKWIAGCPYYLDEASISKKGIEAAPNQVVGTLSLLYVKRKELITLLTELEPLVKEG